MAPVVATFLCVGAAWALFVAIAGVLTQEIPMKRAALFGVVALLMLGGAALQIALGLRARRLARSWDAAEEGD